MYIAGELKVQLANLNLYEYPMLSCFCDVVDGFGDAGGYEFLRPLSPLPSPLSCSLSSLDQYQLVGSVLEWLPMGCWRVAPGGAYGVKHVYSWEMSPNGLSWRVAPCSVGVVTGMPGLARAWGSWDLDRVINVLEKTGLGFQRRTDAVPHIPLCGPSLHHSCLHQLDPKQYFALL